MMADDPNKSADPVVNVTTNRPSAAARHGLSLGG